MSSSPLVIGIDGGGTKTVAWLAPLDDIANTIIFGRGQAGPGNPRAAGFDVAQNNIAAAVAAAFADAQLPRATATAACFGLAGAGREVEQDQISSWATEAGIARQVRVTSDVELVLAAASTQNWGIALACGTGSMAWGRNRDGNADRCGGWGYLLGDEGSGYAIALAGLNAVVRAADGRGGSTALTESFLKSLNAPSAKELVDLVYGPMVTPPNIAACAELVFEAAEHDVIAKGIMARAASSMAELVATLAQRLHFHGGGFPLGMAGSVVVKQAAFRELILDDLLIRGVTPQPVEIVPDPVRGAVALARALAAS